MNCSAALNAVPGLGETLGLPLIYHEVTDHLADRMRLRKSHVVRLLEGKAGLLEKMTADKTSLAIFSADEIFELAMKGEGAIVRGWGATHLLRDVPHVVCVRVCAPLTLRKRRMMQRLRRGRGRASTSRIFGAESVVGLRRRGRGPEPMKVDESVLAAPLVRAAGGVAAEKQQRRGQESCRPLRSRRQVLGEVAARGRRMSACAVPDLRGTIAVAVRQGDAARARHARTTTLGPTGC